MKTFLLFLLSYALLSTFASAENQDGIMTTFNSEGSLYTTGTSINSDGVSAGYYLDTDSLANSFVRNAHGKITTLEVEECASTTATSINSIGAITGYCADTFS